MFALKGKAQDVRAIGALLEASEVLEGTLRRSGENLRITAQLTSTEDGRLMWSERYDRKLDDVFAIQMRSRARSSPSSSPQSLADVATPPADHHTDNVVAYGLYLRGGTLEQAHSEDVSEGIEYFKQAIAADPAYALAYTGLADSYALHIDYRMCRCTKGSRRQSSTRVKPSSSTTLSRKHTRRSRGVSSFTTGTGTALPGSSVAR